MSIQIWTGPVAKSLSLADIEQKKQLIVDTAIHILENDGLDALTVRHLAKQAGVSRQTPFLYFRDKADLLDAVRIAAIRKLMHMTREAVSRSVNASRLEDLRIKGETYVRFALEYPELYRLITTALPHQDTMSEDVRQLLEEYSRMSIEPMQLSWEEGLLSLPPDRLNMVLWASMHGLIALRQEGHVPDDSTFDQLRSDLEFVLSRGFVPRPESAKDPCPAPDGE